MSLINIHIALYSRYCVILFCTIVYPCEYANKLLYINTTILQNDSPKLMNGLINGYFHLTLTNVASYTMVNIMIFTTIT